MAKVDPKILSEIQRKIDGLSRGFSSRDAKAPLRNFLALFVDKIREDKSPVHIDSLIEAFRQYTTTQDVERRFTTLIFMQAFLQQLASTGKVTYHRFLDGVEHDLAPEILNAYTDYNSELGADLDFENRRFRLNVCAMSMVLIEKILVLCATKFSLDRNKGVRGFERMVDGMLPGARAHELMAAYAGIDFNFLDNDLNYLAEGPRVGEADLKKSAASLSPGDVQVHPSGFLSQSGLRPEGLRSELVKIQRIREGILGCLKIPPTEADIDGLDAKIDQYKQACADYVGRLESSQGLADEVTKAEGKKELDFSRFLLVDLPKIFERNLSDVNETIREIQRGHNRIFGGDGRPSRAGADLSLPSKSAGKESNPFAVDLNVSQNKSAKSRSIREHVEPISDFDKFGTDPWAGPDAYPKPTGSRRESAGFGSQAFDNFPGPDVASQGRGGPLAPESDFKKPKHFGNLFADGEEDDPFQKEAKFDDFPDTEDANRIDNFLKKATTPTGLPSTQRKSNFGDAFGGARAEHLDQPVPDSQRGIAKFDDFGNVSANKSGSWTGGQASGGPQGFGRLPFVSQISGISSGTPHTPLAGKRATFGDIFDAPGGLDATGRQAALSLSPGGAAMTRSQFNQRSPISSNLTFKGQSADIRDSQLSVKRPQAQLSFGNAAPAPHNNSFQMRDSNTSETRDNLHNALNRMSNLTSNQTATRGRPSNLQDRPLVTPPRVDISPQPGSGISPINFSSLNTSQGASQSGPSRPPGFSSLHQNTARQGKASISFTPQPAIRPAPATLSDPRDSHAMDAQMQSGAKRPAPFAAIYEDSPAAGKRPTALMGHIRPSRADPDIPRASNIIIGVSPTPPPPVIDFHPPVQAPPTPPPPQISMEDPKAFNLDDFGSVKSDTNRLVESIVESHSNNQGSYGPENVYDLRSQPKGQPSPNVIPTAQRPAKPSSKTPSERNRMVTQVPNPLAMSIPNPAPGFSQPAFREDISPLTKTATDPSLILTEAPRPKKQLGALGADQRSTNSAKQNLPPLPASLEPDNPTISSDARRPENTIPTAVVSRPKQTVPSQLRPATPPRVAHITIAEPDLTRTPLQDPNSAEYSHIILQYEQMIAQYRREITDLKATEGDGRGKLEELNTTIANLRADNVSLNTKLTSLKIDLENQETKHRNQILKLKDDFKKNNDAKLVAIERSYSENLAKTRSDYDQQILSLQQEISSLTMERRTLAEDKGQLRMEKSAQFMELSGMVEQLKQEAGRIQLDLRTAKDKILGELAEKKTAQRAGGGGSNNGIYNQLLAEKKKNVELTKQVLKLTNEALTNAANNPLSAERTTVDISALGLDRLKRQISDAKTSNHRISLAIMATLAKWHMDFSSLLKAKVAAQTNRFLALENGKRVVEQENTNLRFQNEIVSSQLVLAQTGLKVANEELQTVKKELIEVRVMNGNAPRGDTDVELLRKYKRLEQENKQLVEYNKQIQEELLGAQERALEREGDSVPLKTHMMLLKRAEGERDELALTNQNLLMELRGLVEGRGREEVGARKASQASGVKKNKKTVVLDTEISDEAFMLAAPQRPGVRSAYAIPTMQAGGSRAEKTASGALQPALPSAPTKLTVGSALLKKTMDIVRDIRHYDAPLPSFGFLINAIATSSWDDLRVAAFNCTQHRYHLLKTADLQVTIQEDIVFVKSCPEVTMQVTFRNQREGPIRFTDLHMETESPHVRIEAQEDPSIIQVPGGQSKSVWFVIHFQSGYFLDCRPIWALFKSSLELGLFARPGSNGKLPLDGFHRFVLPLSVNKLLETPVERIEKFSVLKTLKTMVNLTLPMAGTLRHERLAAIFPSVCSLNDDEGIFGVKVTSPQGMFFVTFLSREPDTLTILISSMFELKVFEELRETLEFVFRQAFI